MYLKDEPLLPWNLLRVKSIVRVEMGKVAEREPTTEYVKYNFFSSYSRTIDRSASSNGELEITSTPGNYFITASVQSFLRESRVPPSVSPRHREEREGKIRVKTAPIGRRLS